MSPAQECWFDFDADVSDQITAQVPRILSSTVVELDAYEAPRARRNERAMRVYGQRHMISSPQVDFEYEEARELIGYPVIRSVVDSLHADISKARPRVMVVPVATELPKAWQSYRAARKFERWIDGWLSDSGADEKSSRQALDSLIFDVGVLRVMEDEDDAKRVALTRVLPFELRFDPADAFYGEQSRWYQTRFVQKRKLVRRYPDWKREIESAQPTPLVGLQWAHPDNEDVVLVIDAWYIDTDGYGRYAKVCGDALLEWKQWDDDAPFVLFPWTVLPVGVVGDSPANQLVGLQYEINKLMLDMQDAHHLLGKTKIMWPEACGTPESYFDDQVGTIVRVQSMAQGKPEPLTPMAVSPELYQYRNQLKADSYEAVGASQIQAQAQIPTQLSGSGKSIEVYQDATSSRQLPPGRRFEAARVRMCELALQAARRIGGITVRTQRGSVCELLSLSDVQMASDAYILRPYSVSGLSKGITGDYKDIERWIAMGYLTPHEVMKLMQNPASEQQVAMVVAALDVVMNDLEAIFDGEPMESHPPDGYYDLGLTITVAGRAYLRAKADGAPDDVLEQIQLYIARAKDIEAENAAQATQAQVQSQPQPQEPMNA